MEKVQTQLNDEINKIIYSSYLTHEKNIFFVSVAKMQKFKPSSAYYIALQWREITKNFLFTSLKGIGTMAEKINEQPNPDVTVITALQTAVSIIADDLYSANVVFQHSGDIIAANKAHYKWWELSILNPLKSLFFTKNLCLTNSSNNIDTLIQKMKEFSNIPIGAIIQLRVVESIASDICIAFKSIFSQVEMNGTNVYKSEKELSWISSHIKAEKMHQQLVETNFSAALTKIDENISKEKILDLTKDYCSTWNNALVEFATYLE